jgi:molybdopterin converting factor subunit 1
MRIHVKLFAILRERAGIAQTTLELPVDSSAAAAAQRLAERYPAVGDFSRIAYAINRSYVPPTAVLADGDELALIPPVSGG